MVSHLVRLFAEYLADEFARSDGARISLGDGDYLLYLIGRDTCADGTEAREGRRRCDHGIDAEIGILERAELTLKKNILSVPDSLANYLAGVRDIGSDHLAKLHHVVEQLVHIESRLVIDMLEQQILHFADSFELFSEIFLIEQLTDLEADLRILVRIERSDTALCRAEFFILEALLLIGVEHNMIRHHDLRALGNEDIGLRHACRSDMLDLLDELLDIESHAVADDVDRAGLAHA